MNSIKFVDKRDNVEVHLPDGRTLCGARGLSIGEFFKALTSEIDDPIVAAVVNGELRELTYIIDLDSRARPVFSSNSDGALIYRRSLTFLLEFVFSTLFPNALLTIDHSIASGGYYCQVSGRDPLQKNELALLEKTMRNWVEKDRPFTRKKVPLQEAIEYFRSINAQDKLQLISYRTKNYLTLYQLENYMDYHHGYMVPSTGYLKWFGLAQTNGGFTLQFPRRRSATEILPLPEYPKLLTTFRQYGDWLQRLGISSVGALNQAIDQGRIREVILVSEALHDQMISEIASKITSHDPKIQVVLIAGPTSSGKTTFSKRLSIALLARGVNPFPLEMDNYFFDREKTPRNDQGNFDFESIRALDTLQLQADLRSLSSGQPTPIPRYDFRTGLRAPGKVVQLHSDEIILLEGIHGLNPRLIPDYPSANLFRVYVSALTQLNLDRHNRVSTTDTRLIRRITRDARERNYTAFDTIHRWEDVRQGEKENIFPYQENADVMFNSALVYELSALRNYIEPLLLQVPFGTSEYIEAKRLLALLEWFIPINTHLIPDDSILREFIGDSILKDFQLWKGQSHA